MTKEHPILMSTEMVRAILDGRKTQTRRVIKNPTRLEGLMLKGEAGQWCPYGQVGDRLWVRETWGIFDHEISEIAIGYKADPNNAFVEWFVDKRKCFEKLKIGKWRPSIHMPKWAARIWLEITNVRVERVQDISWEDAKSEGIRRDIIPATGDHPNLECWVTIPDDNHAYKTPMAAFQRLWDSLNAKRGCGWDKNPWVWVIEFKRID